MDQAAVEKMCLFSPYAASDTDGFGGVFGADEGGMHDAVEWLGKVAAQAPDRIIGFAWVDAQWPSAVQAMERAADLDIREVKSIPNHG